MIALHVQFHSHRWPFRHGETLEVWSGPTLVCTLSFDLVRNLIIHHLAAHDLAVQFQQQVRPVTRRPLALLPPRAYDPEHRATLRDQRRSRRRRP